MEAMEPVFDFHFGGELEDDVVDIKELELQGNPNPAVTTLVDVVNVEDDTVDKVNQVRRKTNKRKLPPQTPKSPKPKKDRHRSPARDHFKKIKEGDDTWGLVSLDIGLGAVEHYGQLDIGLHDWFILLWRLLCLVALNYYGLVVVFILDL
ncbi:hypothetical protein RHMOL_Rhmol05G0210000 [Rhododendron molle]|uniref:Uncharacterized protein n=1 Tax=Rhododendron molle TaxID=49168 RepID=A0ACC0NTT2_RHOML|nr:hypothetical protein RHMOL_Rhmol05G0210000 [Rhododendron molle]